MKRWSFALSLSMVLLSAGTSLADAPSEGHRARMVRQFMAAFNAHDEHAMGALVTEDVEWASIEGATLTMEVQGRAALTEAMAEYFASCSSCRSSIADLLDSGLRVSVVEVAAWEGADGPTTQRALAVYEFDGALIRRVYYFPAQADADASITEATCHTDGAC